MKRPRLFAELCCGSAALTLKLVGGSKCRSPVSYQGSKRMFATSILTRLGLAPGIGADAILLVDPGPWSRAWPVLTTPAGRERVSASILSMVGEAPRDLWNRLKAEGPLAGDVGVAQWLVLSASNRLIHADWTPAGVWKNCGAGGTTFGGEEFATPPEKVAAAVDALAGVPWPVVRVDGVSAVNVDPEEVAKWLLLHRWSFSERGPAHGYGGPGCVVRTERTGWTTENRDAALERPRLAERVTAVPAFPPLDSYAGSAADLYPQGDLTDCVVYIDPDYVGTTPYRHSLPRPQVIEVARRWAAQNATVCVSEAEPISDLVGWHTAEITNDRQGHRRSFSKQQREWITCNRPLLPYNNGKVQEPDGLPDFLSRLHA